MSKEHSKECSTAIAESKRNQWMDEDTRGDIDSVQTNGSGLFNTQWPCAELQQNNEMLELKGLIFCLFKKKFLIDSGGHKKIKQRRLTRS